MSTPPTECWKFPKLDDEGSKRKPRSQSQLRWIAGIFATVVGIGFFAAVHRPRLSDERIAIEAIRKSNGSVTTARTDSVTGACDAIVAVEIYDPREVGASLWKTGILTHPEALRSLRAPLDGEDLKRLAPFRHLRELDLFNSNISDSSLQHLAQLKDLEVLIVRCKSISDSGMHYLRDLPRLRVLVVSSTKITDQGLADICQIRSLRELSIAKTNITDHGLEHVARLENLVRLNIANTAVSDAGLTRLCTLKHLNWINVDQTGVTEAGVDALQRDTPCVLYHGL